MILRDVVGLREEEDKKFSDDEIKCSVHDEGGAPGAAA